MTVVIVWKAKKKKKTRKKKRKKEPPHTTRHSARILLQCTNIPRVMKITRITKRKVLAFRVLQGLSVFFFFFPPLPFLPFTV